jgi:hypothetical protein
LILQDIRDRGLGITEPEILKKPPDVSLFRVRIPPVPSQKVKGMQKGTARRATFNVARLGRNCKCVVLKLLGAAVEDP